LFRPMRRSVSAIAGNISARVEQPTVGVTRRRLTLLLSREQAVHDERIDIAKLGMLEGFGQTAHGRKSH